MSFNLHTSNNGPESLENLSETELVQRAKNNDMEALCELLARHKQTMLVFLKIRVGDRAEDIWQDVILKLLQKGIGGFDPAKNLRAWLQTVVRNQCIDWHRSNARHQSSVSFEELRGASTWMKGNDPDPAMSAIQQEMAGCVREAIGSLQPHYREVVELRCHGQTYTEIAEALHIPIGTVKSRMHLATKTLQQNLPNLL